MSIPHDALVRDDEKLGLRRDHGGRVRDRQEVLQRDDDAHHLRGGHREQVRAHDLDHRGELLRGDAREARQDAQSRREPDRIRVRGGQDDALAVLAEGHLLLEPQPLEVLRELKRSTHRALDGVVVRAVERAAVAPRALDRGVRRLLRSRSLREVAIALRPRVVRVRRGGDDDPSRDGASSTASMGATPRRRELRGRGGGRHRAPDDSVVVAVELSLLLLLQRENCVVRETKNDSRPNALSSLARARRRHDVVVAASRRARAPPPPPPPPLSPRRRRRVAADSARRRRRRAADANADARRDGPRGVVDVRG
eukprot:31497-Pelagococcus_subviridis.AAC.71